MIIGTLTDGTKCVYDLPNNIKTAEEMQSLVYGYNNGRMAESQRPELYNQPKLLSLNGPMWNGWGTLKSTGETVAIIRYEKPSKFQPKRSDLERQPRDGRRGSDDGRPERENMKTLKFENNKIYSTSSLFEKTDVFEIVEKIPVRFFVWNIGENMGTHEYIPVCEDLHP